MKDNRGKEEGNGRARLHFWGMMLLHLGNVGRREMNKQVKDSQDKIVY